MKESNLHIVANYIYTFLLLIKKNIFNETDILKKIPKLALSSIDNLRGCPFPTSHIKVLLYIEKYNSSSISKIGQSLNISKPNMTPIIDNLINYGLIRKYTDPNDRRIVRVEITELAYKIFNSFSEYSISSISEKLEIMSDDDINILETSLKNVNSIFCKYYNK